MKKPRQNMNVKKFTHTLLTFLLAAILTMGCAAEANAKSRRGASRGKAKTTAVRKSSRRASTAKRYKNSKSRRTAYRNRPQRNRRNAAVTINLPFSISDKIYLAGITPSQEYMVLELLGNEARSVEKFSTSGGNTVKASFMSGGEVFSVSNTASGTKSKAYIMWNGKTINDLTSNATSNHANAIWVWDDEMYVAGVSGSTAVLWTNGKTTELEDGGTSAALDVCYANKQTYCCGYAVDGSGTRHARIWSSGGKVQIPAPMSCISAIMVSGSSVWVAGTAPDGKAVAYKNAEPLPLNSDNGAVANSIVAAGDNVYVAGTVTEGGAAKATLWVNGEPLSLDALNLHDVKLMRKN